MDAEECHRCRVQFGVMTRKVSTPASGRAPAPHLARTDPKPPAVITRPLHPYQDLFGLGPGGVGSEVTWGPCPVVSALRQSSGKAALPRNGNTPRPGVWVCIASASSPLAESHLTRLVRLGPSLCSLKPWPRLVPASEQTPQTHCPVKLIY